MKFLAVELPTSEKPIPENVLKREAALILEYYESGSIENIYFNEERNAVLILNAENKDAAYTILNALPLVTEGYISFEVMSLLPYTGFSRFRR